MPRQPAPDLAVGRIAGVALDPGAHTKVTHVHVINQSTNDGAHSAVEDVEGAFYQAFFTVRVAAAAPSRADRTTSSLSGR